jgi:phospholipid/cholesterol/gamma-HCH transport system permease protein
MLAVAVLLELAPISAGLILAARTGASLGAELAAMRVTEQVDALEVLGLSSVRELVGPRVLACVLAMPLLDIFIATTALLGGYAAESVGGTMNWLQFRDAAFDDRFLRLTDVVAATLKTTVFGFLVGVTGCYAGLTAYGGSEAVGRAATRGVVWSIVLVLLADVVLVGVIQTLGGMKLP